MFNISQSSNFATINSPRTVGILTLTPRRRSRGTPTRKETTTSNRATFPTSSSSLTSGSTINLGTTQVCSLPSHPFYQYCCPLYATGRLIALCSLFSGHFVQQCGTGLVQSRLKEITKMKENGEQHIEEPIPPGRGICFRFPAPDAHLSNPLIAIQRVSFCYPPAQAVSWLLILWTIFMAVLF